MSGVSWRSEFADYQAIGTGGAIMPSVSMVIPAKNEARNLEHVFDTIEKRIDDKGTSVPENVIIKSGIKELKWS